MNPLKALANRLLAVFVPLTVARSYEGWAQEWLADVEADHEAWQPDELWAATQRHPAGKAPEQGRPRTGGSTDPSPRGSVPPASTAFTVDGAGRHSKPEPYRSDQQVIEELVEDFRQFIEDCFDRRNRN